MALAQIKMSQATLPIVVAGVARDDIRKGVPVVLRNGDDTGVSSWRWVLLYRPPGSAAALINPNSSAANITPDAHGSYRVQLSIGQGRLSHGETQIKVFRVRDASGFAAPAAGERGAESNYLIDGNPNTASSADEFVRRYLKMFNNRDDPYEFALLSGANTVLQIPWPLRDAMFQYLKVTSSDSVNLALAFYADLALTMPIWALSGIDATAGYTQDQHRTLTFGYGLAQGKLYLKVSNNGVDTTLAVSLRLGAM